MKKSALFTVISFAVGASALFGTFGWSPSCFGW